MGGQEAVGGWTAGKEAVHVGSNKGEVRTVGDRQERGMRPLTLMVFVCSLRPLRVLMALSASLGSE